ncbi:MAG TPA: RHS repeat-associated core domain-containing protein [Gemmataceae bacterium]|nr:RHS repeat-associated core domain-containing protein [Gemmataceae bacterium]
MSADSSGNVTIDFGGSLATFPIQANGAYLDTDGEYGALTKSGGVYTFTDPAGVQSVFLSNGLLSYQQDTNGNRITLGYNAQNQLATLTYSNPADPSQPTEQLALSYNAQGFVSQVADGTGNTWSYSYDAAGHLAKVQNPDGTSITYTYDTSFNKYTTNALLSITNPDGSQQNFTYNNNTGQLTGASANGGADAVTYTYPGEGEVVATDSAGDQTTVWFNAFGLPGQVQSPLGGVSTYQYDDNGNVIGSTDALGDAYQYSYDANGNQTQIINPLGQTVDMTYGALSNLASITDAGGNTTQYKYNSAGNLLSITYPDATQQSFTYDPLGNLSETVLQNGDPIDYQYNAEGLVTKETFADLSNETFVYDAHGNLTTAKSFNAAGTLTGTTTLVYNAAGTELTSISYPNGLSLTFSYNALGQRIQSVDQAGYTVNYIYDALGRLVKLTDASNNLIVQYAYNGLGQLAQKTNGNGTYTTYGYDTAGDLTSEVNYANAGGTTINSSFTYTYNLLGEQTSVTDAAGDRTTYGYDALGQLTQVNLPGAAGAVDYVYNAAGDRTEVISNGTPTAYASNADNEITQVGSATYTYDANGNLHMVKDASGTTTYTYNDLNQLTSIVNPDGSVQNFQYSPLGFMVGTSTTTGANTSQTNYLVDPTGFGNIVGAYTGSGSLIADYTYGLGLVRQTGPSGTGYYDFDASGNTVGVTGASGGYVNQYTYLPFGETTTVKATLPNPFTFAGQVGVLEVAPNLLYMRARYYTALTGQFLSPDPLGLNSGDFNIRRYAGNNPVALVDPSGLQGEYTGGCFDPINGGKPGASTYGPGEPVPAPGGNGGGSQGNGNGNGGGNGGGNGSGDKGGDEGGDEGGDKGGDEGGDKGGNGGGNEGGDTGENGNKNNSNHTPPEDEPPSGIGCFPPNTLVATESGPKPIGQVEVGEQVWSYDFPRGIWRLCGIEACHVFDRDGLLITLDLGVEEVTATDDHPFWVITGQGLRERPTPRHIGACEDTDGSLPGRWVDAHDLREGDMVFLRSAGPQMIRRVWARHVRTPVCNLTVKELHNFAVGNTQVLVHNKIVLPPIHLPLPPIELPPFENPFEGPFVNPFAPIAPGGEQNFGNILPKDPNALVGPAGLGAPGFVQDGGNLPYTIDFENDGSAAAQVVTVTEQLNANLDWSTFQLGTFGFGPINVAIPAGLTEDETTVKYQNTDGSSLNVLVDLNFNVQTGLLTVTFTSLDPLTGQAPTGVFDGFLPPNNKSNVGQGYVQYTVQPKAGLTNSPQITGQASVVFDVNAAISTNTVSNIVETPRPTAILGADGSLELLSPDGSSQPLSPAGTIAAVSAVTDASGGTDVYVITTAGHTLWEHTSAGWSEISGGYFGQISAATNSAGNAVVFGILGTGAGGYANSLWEDSSLNPGGWAMLSPGGTILSISAVTDSSGGDDVFAVTADTHLWEHTPSGWTMLSVGSFQQISAGLNAAGQAVVYGVLTDNSLWEYNPAFAGSWQNLSPSGTILGVTAGGPDEVFAITAFGPNNLWQHTNAGWAELSPGSFASLSAPQYPTGQDEVFATLTGSSFWEYSAGLTNPWEEVLVGGAAGSSSA